MSEDKKDDLVDQKIMSNKEVDTWQRRRMVRSYMYAKMNQVEIKKALSNQGINVHESTISRDCVKIREEETGNEDSANKGLRQNVFKLSVANLFKQGMAVMGSAKDAKEKIKCLEFCLKCELVIADANGVRGELYDNFDDINDPASYVEQFLHTTDGKSLEGLQKIFSSSVEKWHGDAGEGEQSDLSGEDGFSGEKDVESSGMGDAE